MNQDNKLINPILAKVCRIIIIIVALSVAVSTNRTQVLLEDFGSWDMYR